MGARQSYLYIHLRNRVGKYGQQGYTVEPTKSVVTECKNFEVITHKIKYVSGDGTNFDIYIYDSKRPFSTNSYIFAYCSPSDKNQVVDEVKVYFSVFIPDEPLVISFHTKGGHNYNCLPRVLKDVGWDYGANITGHSFTDDLSKILPKLYEKVSLNWKIQFLADSDLETTISSRTDDIGNDDTYKAYVYKPTAYRAAMGSNKLFKNLTNSNPKNRVDSSYLGSVNKQFYDGIVVYTKQNIALLLEFRDPCKKIHIQRKDKDATYWAEGEIVYGDDKSLAEQLGKIDSASTQNDVVTYMLDKFEKYNDVTVAPGDTTTTYTKYKHNSDQEKAPNIVFKGVKVTIGKKPYDTKTKTLEVYYLKFKGEKADERDSRPFLIVFDPDGKEEKQKKKAYHFMNTENFGDWIEYDEEKLGALDKKLDLIKSSGGCRVDLQALRNLVHKILTEKLPEPPKKAEPPPGPTRPDIYVPEPETKGPPLEWIITGSVGGVVFVGSSAVGYGVYWYNTTIKLLT